MQHWVAQQNTNRNNNRWLNAVTTKTMLRTILGYWFGLMSFLKSGLRRALAGGGPRHCWPAKASLVFPKSQRPRLGRFVVCQDSPANVKKKTRAKNTLWWSLHRWGHERVNLHKSPLKLHKGASLATPTNIHFCRKIEWQHKQKNLHAVWFQGCLPNVGEKLMLKCRKPCKTKTCVYKEIRLFFMNCHRCSKNWTVLMFCNSWQVFIFWSFKLTSGAQSTVTHLHIRVLTPHNWTLA